MATTSDAPRSGFAPEEPDAHRAVYQELLSRVGIVEDPFRQQMTVKLFLVASLMIRQSLGAAEDYRFYETLVSRHCPPDPDMRARCLRLLHDEHGWINIHLNHAGGIIGALLLRRPDYWYQVGFQTLSHPAFAYTSIAASLGPAWIYKNVAVGVRNYNSIFDLIYQKEGSRSGSARILKKNYDSYAKELTERYGKLAPEIIHIDCQVLDGALAAIPLLAGLPPARVTHMRCAKDGADTCEILVEWQKPRLPERVFRWVLGLLPSQRRLLENLGQLEVLVRERTAAVEESHKRMLAQSQDLVKAEAQVQTGRTYAASAAHDINNALGPARSGIEEILEVLRRAHPLPSPASGATEVVEADFSRELGQVPEEKLSELVDAFEKLYPAMKEGERRKLLDNLDFLAKLTRALRVAVPEIYRGINRATDFTTFMNEVARTDYIEQRAPVRLDELLRNLLAKYQNLWETRGILLESAIEPSITVSGWPRVFESIFSNLLDNAAQAVENCPEKRVQVELRREGDRSVATVSDSGPGVPEEIKDKIFEFGFTTRPAKGKGFGLGFVRIYVLLLGGDIGVQNRPSGGTAFAMHLPLT
jgi:signal transduction histidine kinase